jgi:hypothetical protein
VTGGVSRWFLPVAFPENQSTSPYVVLLVSNTESVGLCHYRVGLSCNADGASQASANAQSYGTPITFSVTTDLAPDVIARVTSAGTTPVTPVSQGTGIQCTSTNCDNMDCILSVENDYDTAQVGTCDFYGLYIGNSPTP